jgi:uncharacterized integral membrane protein (TIGR00698 family)
MSKHAPGLLVAMLIAGVATLAARQLHWPDMLVALGLGLVFAQTLRGARWHAGLSFASRTVLRAGIALLGFRVTVTQLATLGWPTLVTVIAGIVSVFAAAWAFARVLRLPAGFAAIAATSVAICGASAALAAAAVLPKREQLRDATLFVCVAVSLIGTIAMIVYPTLTELTAWDSTAAAVFLGASIHEVAQVVGAAFALSPGHGELATLTKLLRVALLAPVVMALRWQSTRRAAGGTDAEQSSVEAVPPFLIVFIALVAGGSFLSWPQPLVDGASLVSRMCLLTAIAALGLLTRSGSLLRLGWQPVVLMVVLTLVIAAVAALGVTAGALFAGAGDYTVAGPTPDPGGLLSTATEAWSILQR